jgi:hypothetical protein
MTIHRTALALATLTCALATTASTAGAATINGISGNPYFYAGTGVNHGFSTGGLNITCATASYAGMATGASTTNFQAAFGGSGGIGTKCTSGLLGPYYVTATGTWRLTATSTTAGTLTIPQGSKVELKPVNIPSCVIKIGPQSPVGGLSMASYGGIGTTLSGTVSLAYTHDDPACIIPSSGFMTYTTSGAVSIPGVVTAP